MNFGLSLATNKLPGTHFDLAQLTGESLTPDADPYQVQLKLEQLLLDGDVSKQTHQTIEQHIVSPELTAQGVDPKRPPNLNVIAGLLLGSPEFLSGKWKKLSVISCQSINYVVVQGASTT